MLAGTMHYGDTPEQRIVVRDISSQGIGARATGTPPAAGERVSLYLSQGRLLTGRVRWVRGDRFGVLLDATIDPNAFLGSGGSWEVVEQKFPPGHVYDQFKPVGRAYRPGLKAR